MLIATFEERGARNHIDSENFCRKGKVAGLFLDTNVNVAKSSPEIITKGVSSFVVGVKTMVLNGVIVVQLMAAPIKIAAVARLSVGVVREVVSFSKVDVG